MAELNLELNHTYLLQFGSSDVLSSVTVLVITDKAYYLRWNRGVRSNDTWELKDMMYRNYNVIEDISDVKKDIEIKEAINTPNIKTTWKVCPECQGVGWFPDNQTTGGRTTCTNCYGSRKVIDIVEVF